MNLLDRWRAAAADYVIGVGIAIAMTAVARYTARTLERRSRTSGG